METSTNSSSSVQPAVKKGRPRVKKVACFTAFFTVILLSCILVVGFLWAGGWAKSFSCSVVEEGSYIWTTLMCVSTGVSEVQKDDEVITIQIPEGVTSTEELVTTIIEKASPAVVTIAVNTLEYDYQKGYVDEQSGIGSGFIVDSDGIIITNQHVVSDENADYSVILPEGNEIVPVTEIHRDATNDIAILKIDKSGLRALKLGDSSAMKKGNLVIAMGSPFGDLDGTATSGIISGLHRDVSAGSGYAGSVTHYEGVLQTDAAINPGNSGGPLLNSRGEVIGVNFATTQGADNTSFAIPINIVEDRLEVFEKEGRFPQPYIGISYSQRSIIVNNEVITGAVIFEIEKDGPADRGGLRKGDIILEVNGESMAEASLSEIIQSADVDDKLRMEVWNEGETRTVEVVVGDKGA